MLLYTSGTTGQSKGAVITHDNVLATVTGLLAAWAWEPADALLLTLPLFHTHGLVVGLHCALAAGATVHLRRRFDAAEAAADLIAGEAPTLFFGVPTMYVRLVEELRRRRLATASLRRLRLFCSGSAPLAPETFAAFRELTGHDILERYGMTETGMNLSNPYAGPRRRAPWARRCRASPSASSTGRTGPAARRRGGSPGGGLQRLRRLLAGAGEDGRELRPRRPGPALVPHRRPRPPGPRDRLRHPAGAAAAS